MLLVRLELELKLVTKLQLKPPQEKMFNPRGVISITVIATIPEGTQFLK